eukprot:g17583.t1
MIEDGGLGFPLVLRWYKVETVDRDGKALKLSKQEHSFLTEADLGEPDFEPDFGGYRTFDNYGFPTVLLQHKEDAPTWPPIDNVLQWKKTCENPQKNMDNSGGDMARADKGTASAEDCRKACEQAAECEAYTYNKQLKVCMLKLQKEPKMKENAECCDSGRCEETKRTVQIVAASPPSPEEEEEADDAPSGHPLGRAATLVPAAPSQITAVSTAANAGGLVLTNTEIDGMKAKAAAALKAWQDDEAARNAKTEKRLSKADLKSINLLFTSNSSPLASPHNSKIYVGGTPAVDLGGGGGAFGGISMNDGPQGFRGHGDAGKTVYGEGKPTTMFPAGAAIGMSWDPEFAYVYARSMAKEFRINRANMILGPTVQTWRVPLSGRNFESLAGEDPAIAATLLPAYKKATNELGVSTSLKHYVLNDFEANRYRSKSKAPLTAVFELQLKAFAAGIAMGGTSVMCAYNWICAHADEKGVVTEKDCLGNCLNKYSLGWILPLSDRFFVVSDWGASGHPYFESYGHEDSPAFYLEAGLSSEQPSSKVSWATGRVFENEGAMNQVDETLRRKMAQRIVAAMEDVEMSGGADLLKDATISDADHESEIETKHKKIGYRLVAESTALLKNEGKALPLLLRAGDGEKGVQITTYGCGRKPHTGGDCYSADDCRQKNKAWDSPDDVFYGGTGSGLVEPIANEEVQTIAAALDDAAKELSALGIGVDVLGHKGLESTLTLGPKQEGAPASESGKREVALVCDTTGSGEGGDRGSLKLNKLEKIVKSGKKDAAFQVVLFLSTPGYIELPEANLVDPADAILLSVFPGQYVGGGLMQLLFNKTPPSAKLSFTIGNYDSGKTYTPNVINQGQEVLDYTKTDGPDGMQTGHRWYQAQAAKPLFPFGHGLTSLADWGKDFKVTVSKHDATLRRISFCVDFSMPAGADAWTKLNANAGDGRNEVKASPVVQFYVKKQEPAARNYLELLTFAKLREMKPGEKRCGAVFYTEPVATYSPAKRKYVPSTAFQLWVGLNGYGAESGATQVPATTEAAQPELPEYTLQDYRSFVIETVKKEEIEAAARPNLAKHLSYLTNGDQVHKSWAL